MRNSYQNKKKKKTNKKKRDNVKHRKKLKTKNNFLIYIQEREDHMAPTKPEALKEVVGKK